MTQTLNAQQMQQLHVAFKLIDVHGKNYCSAAVWTQIMQSLGYPNADKTIIERLIRELISSDNSGKFDFTEFVTFIYRFVVLQQMQTDEREAYLHHLFTSIDATQKGYLDASDLALLVQQTGETLNKEQMADMMNELDPENTGRVTFAKWRDMMLTQ